MSLLMGIYFGLHWVQGCCVHASIYSCIQAYIYMQAYSYVQAYNYMQAYDSWNNIPYYTPA